MSFFLFLLTLARHIGDRDGADYVDTLTLHGWWRCYILQLLARYLHKSHGNLALHNLFLQIPMQAVIINKLRLLK